MCGLVAERKQQPRNLIARELISTLLPPPALCFLCLISLWDKVKPTASLNNPGCTSDIVIAMVTSLAELQSHLRHYLSSTKSDASVLVMCVIIVRMHYT